MSSKRDAIRSGPWIKRLTLARLGTTAAALLTVIAATACGSSSNGNAGSSVTGGGSTCSADQAAGTINYVSPFQYSATASVIDVLEAQKLGYFKQLCLTVDFNSASDSPQELVAADRAQISATQSASSVIGFISQGDPIVGVATLGKYSSSTIILPKQDTTLSQLNGQTFGYYNQVTPGYLQLLVKGGADLNKVKFVKLTDHDPSIIKTGQVQGLDTFLDNQDLTLQQEGIPYTEITPASLGIQGTSSVYYMNKSFLKDYPVAAQNFMRADLKAVQYCLNHQSACIQTLADDATQAGQGAVYGVKQVTPVWTAQAKVLASDSTSPLGAQSTSLWTPDYDTFKAYNQKSSVISGLKPSSSTLPPLSSMLNTSLVDGLYKNGQLIWP